MKKVIVLAAVAMLSFSFSNPQKPQNKTDKNISCDAFAEKTGVKITRSTQKVNSNDKNLYFVKVTISNDKGIHAFGKYQDEVAQDVTVSQLKANYGQVRFEENVIKHTFFGLPSDAPVEITYFMELANDVEPSFNGELAFLENSSKIKGCLSLN
jgi:hypothetical protein